MLKGAKIKTLKIIVQSFLTSFSNLGPTQTKSNVLGD
jgi:hypothetical protein